MSIAPIARRGLLLSAAVSLIGAAAHAQALYDLTTVTGDVLRGYPRRLRPDVVIEDEQGVRHAFTWNEVWRLHVVGIPEPVYGKSPWLLLGADGTELRGALDVGAVRPSFRHYLKTITALDELDLLTLERNPLPDDVHGELRDFACRGEGDAALVVVRKGDRYIRLRSASLEIHPEFVRFRWHGRAMRVPWARLAGIAWSRGAPAAPRTRLVTVRGDVLPIEEIDGDSDGLHLRSVLLGRFDLDWDELLCIEHQSPFVTWLVDLPAEYRCLPLLGQQWPYYRERTLRAGTPRLDGIEQPRAIVMHSASTLEFELGGEYTHFAATVGLTDDGPALASADVAVVGDGRVLYRANDLRRGKPPRRLCVEVVGVQRLTLRVDYGRNLDIGDEVCWGAARLIGPPRDR